MNFNDISLPEIYKDSMDFRTLLNWFDLALTRIKYDTTNFLDLYDPLRCKSELLWMLGWTMGFKYDDRLPVAYNRLIILYFMNMLKYKGSITGIIVAAELNLAQFNILDYGKEKDILYERLEDTSIPVNTVYVTSHVAEGYIDVVYFSDKIPLDACIEYVRPLGMYVFSHAGVKFDARTKITLDARLTNIQDMRNPRTNIPIGYVAQYNRDDYASMQRMYDESRRIINVEDTRNRAWYRNSAYEESPTVDSGWRTLYSLQMSNNEHIVRSLIEPIFNLQYGPQDIEITYPDNYLKMSDPPNWNLSYNRNLEEHLVDITAGITSVEYNSDGSMKPISEPIVYRPNITTIDDGSSIIKPIPRINPVMAKLGDAVALDDTNTQFTKVQANGEIRIVDQNNNLV